MIFLSPLLHIVKMFILTVSVLTQLGSGILCPQIVFLNSFPIAFPSFSSSFSCNFMPSMEWNPVKNLHRNSLYQKILFSSFFVAALPHPILFKEFPNWRAWASAIIIYLFIFFLSGFSFTYIHDSQDSRGRERLSI